MKRKPLAVDLYCGLGGWTHGLLAEGWDVVGFDIERHVYGDERYPAALILQDVRSIDGARLKDASLIVASSPCQEFSWRAMPWKAAKAAPPPLLGMELFAQAERIQCEAIAAAGHFIPMVQENVRGAQKYVGRARWHYGSYYLWGDVPALMPITLGRSVMKAGIAHRANGATNFHGYDATKVPSVEGRRTDPGKSARFTSREGADDSVKVGGSRGDDWFTHHNRDEFAERAGVKQGGISGERANGKGDAWFQDGAAAHGSKSSARKAASARIAKIPFPLAQHIARVYHPDRVSA
jgi:hypothetical protein